MTEILILTIFSREVKLGNPTFCEQKPRHMTITFIVVLRIFREIPDQPFKIQKPDRNRFQSETDQKVS
jgi:hypothetical protein